MPIKRAGYDRADVLAHADTALADAAAAYLELSDPEWLAPGSTSSAAAGEKRRGRRAGPPDPANIDVLDYLALAESEVLDLAGELLGLDGAYADDPGEWRGALAAGPSMGEAFGLLRDRLPELPAEMAAEVCAAAWRLANRGSKLLGGDAPILKHLDRRACPACGRRSFVPHPVEPAVWVCSTRSCAHRDPSPSDE